MSAQCSSCGWLYLHMSGWFSTGCIWKELLRYIVIAFSVKILGWLGFDVVSCCLYANSGSIIAFHTTRELLFQWRWNSSERWNWKGRSSWDVFEQYLGNALFQFMEWYWGCSCLPAAGICIQLYVMDAIACSCQLSGELWSSLFSNSFLCCRLWAWKWKSTCTRCELCWCRVKSPPVYWERIWNGFTEWSMHKTCWSSVWRYVRMRNGSLGIFFFLISR